MTGFRPDADPRIAEARKVDILRAATELGAKLKSISRRTEWAGACPVCGGVDRFRAVSEQIESFGDSQID
jgi:hypothetical protein